MRSWGGSSRIGLRGTCEGHKRRDEGHLGSGNLVMLIFIPSMKTRSHFDTSMLVGDNHSSTRQGRSRSRNLRLQIRHRLQSVRFKVVVEIFNFPLYFPQGYCWAGSSLSLISGTLFFSFSLPTNCGATGVRLARLPSTPEYRSVMNLGFTTTSTRSFAMIYSCIHDFTPCIIGRMEQR